jgi:hypothetical protein
LEREQIRICPTRRWLEQPSWINFDEALVRAAKWKYNEALVRAAKSDEDMFGYAILRGAG